MNFISVDVVDTTGDNVYFRRVKYCRNGEDSNPYTGVNGRFVHEERRAVNMGTGHQLIDLAITVVGAARPLSLAL